MSRSDLQSAINELTDLKGRMTDGRAKVAVIVGDIELLRMVLQRNMAAAETEFRDRLSSLEFQVFEMKAALTLAEESVGDAENKIAKAARVTMEGLAASQLNEKEAGRVAADQFLNSINAAEARMQEAEVFLRQATHHSFSIGQEAPLLKMVAE